MAETNDELVRAYFELRGYFVRANVLYEYRTTQGMGWSDIDLCAIHPRSGDAAAVEVKGWHTEHHASFAKGLAEPVPLRATRGTSSGGGTARAGRLPPHPRGWPGRGPGPRAGARLRARAGRRDNRIPHDPPRSRAALTRGFGGRSGPAISTSSGEPPPSFRASRWKMRSRSPPCCERIGRSSRRPPCAGSGGCARRPATWPSRTPRWRLAALRLIPIEPEQGWRALDDVRRRLGLSEPVRPSMRRSGR